MPSKNNSTHSNIEPSISIIVAVALNGVIGNNNELPWKIPGELKYFKQKTINKTVIMGKKTFLSLPGGALAKRQNIILTSNQKFKADNIITASSLEDGIKIGQKLQKEIMIIGGARVFKEGLKYASQIYLTEVMLKPKGDVYFPKLDKDIWQEISRQAIYNNDNKITHSYTILQKII